VTTRYDEELAALPDLYERARRVPVDEPAAVLGHGRSPLLVVGSGGSASVARLLADLAMASTGVVARPLTPLELIGTARLAPGTRVALVSARGANADVLAAWDRVVDDGLRDVLVLCGDATGPLGRAAAEHSEAVLVEFPRVAAREGFVACGSVLAPAVVGALGLGTELPRRFEELWSRVRIPAAAEHLWERSSLIVLHGLATAGAALDLESKFAEGALGAVSLSDFRNFAHGRYLELERRVPETAVLMLESVGDARVAGATAERLPSDALVERVRVAGDPRAAGVGALLAVLHLAGAAAHARGVDLAAGGREPFGPTLYGLDVSGEAPAPPVEGPAPSGEGSSDLPPAR